MNIFFPKIGTQFFLTSDASLKLVSNKYNAKFLHKLNLLPGCLPVSAWKKNLYLQNIDVVIPKETQMEIEKIDKDENVHFIVYLGKKQYQIALPLNEINNKFDIDFVKNEAINNIEKIRSNNEITPSPKKSM